MAKIKTVKLQSIPEEIHVNDDLNDLTVITVIEFHSIDLKLEMEYCLYLFVYDIHGSVDIPVIISNWDESHIKRVSTDRKDDFLGMTSLIVKPSEKTMEITTDMKLRLGTQMQSSSHYSRKLNVFASLIPAIERASKRSAPFEAKILY